MTQELNIAIFRLTPGWKTVLSQAGVPYREIGQHDQIEPSLFSVIIVNRPVTNREFGAIDAYCRAGGALLDTGYCVHALAGGSFCTRHAARLHDRTLSWMRCHEPLEIHNKITVFSKAQHLGQALYLDNYGNGAIGFLGLDVDSLLFDARSRTRAFYVEQGEFPYEEVSLVSKGGITRLIFSFLRHLHTIRRLPFVHIWFFPKGARNVFLFRIDSDNGTSQQVMRWHEAAQAQGIRCTWFLHVAAHEQWLDRFAEFNGHEIAVHGYGHFTSINYPVLKDNITKAAVLLNKNGFTFTGHAAPYGIWSPALDAVCREAGFLYSSEFSYAYDSLPIRPVSSHTMSGVLQVPVHPVCIGSLIKAGADDRGILDYYKRYCDRQMTQLNPCALYDHVLHDRHDAVREVFRIPGSLGIPPLTFGEFARFWMQRENTEFRTSVNTNGTVTVTSQTADQNMYYGIWSSDTVCTVTGTPDENMTPDSNQLTFDSSDQKDVARMKQIHRWNWRRCKNSAINRLFWRKYS